ncbi:MAG: polysaccharide deacetylase family protein [Clostridia bacterium]|nr:polysaccharide deacetylase family protein [Clostridia bacterium]
MFSRKIKIKYVSVLAAILVAVMLCTSVSAESMGWYCVHVKDHRQPTADARLAEVERHGGYYIDHNNTSPTAESKVVYLTFDAGYCNENLEKIIDVLAAEQVTGAFFILGNLAKSNPDTVKRMADGGNLVCNHTYTHKDMSDKPIDELAAELKRLEEECKVSAGVEVAKYFRPPEGKFSTQMLDNAVKLGYKTVFWSFAYADWDNNRQMSTDKAKAKIMENIHNGAVILLHPTSATNAQILGDVIRELKADGYRFGSLDELTGEQNA